jgi:hypothetical protein
MGWACGYGTDVRNMHKILVMKPLGERQLADRQRWEDNNNMISREDWRWLKQVQNRDTQSDSALAVFCLGEKLNMSSCSIVQKA